MRWFLLILALCLPSGLKSGETIRVATQEWTTLNPLLLAQDSDGEAVDLLFDRLVTLDAKGNFIPEMLESWAVLNGGREVVLKLRPGLAWHDGRPIEAEDLVFTWRSLRLPQVRRVADTVSGVASLDSLSAEGPLTVRIRLQRPRGTLLSDLYNFIPVPRHHYEMGARPADAAVNFAPVGSGPYRVAGVATSRYLRLERWEGYRGPHPGQAAAFELVDNPEDREVVQLFESERLHFALVGQLRHYLIRKGAQGVGHIRAISLPSASLSAYFLNCDPQRSLLGDRRLRRVIAELVPWQDQARARRFFPARMATSFWPPETWAHDPTPRPLPQVERAAALLDEAGWLPGPDGIRRDAKGRRLVLVAYEPAPATKRGAAHLLSLQAARVGISVEVRTEAFSRVLAHAARHEGDLWAFGWTLALDPDVDSPLFTREGYRTGANMSAYLNPELDRLFDEGRHTLDPQARKAIYLEISRIIGRDKPVIPTGYAQSRILIHRRLQGLGHNALGQSFGFWPGRRGWTLGK